MKEENWHNYNYTFAYILDTTDDFSSIDVSNYMYVDDYTFILSMNLVEIIFFVWWWLLRSYIRIVNIRNIEEGIRIIWLFYWRQR